MMTATLLLLSLLVTIISCHVNRRLIDDLNYDDIRVRRDTDITLSVSSTRLNASGDEIVVSWSGVKDPDNNDWIGVYVLERSGGILDPIAKAPVKYQLCNVSSSHITDGKGSMRLRLVNMRAPYVVALLRKDKKIGWFSVLYEIILLSLHSMFGASKSIRATSGVKGFTSPVLVASSDEITFTNVNERLQVHLSLTNDPTEMIVLWVTKDVKNPKVRWTTKTSNNYNDKAANSTRYSASDMCGAPATTVGYLDPGQINQVTIDGLMLGEEYIYQVGDENGWSEMYYFTASPGADASSTTRIIAYGDMGEVQQDDTLQHPYSQPGAINTTNQVIQQKDNIDMILHIGDISYAEGYAGVWEEFFDLIQPIASRVPYMVCIGNHERDAPNSGSYYNGTDSGGECGVPYDIRLPMPRPARDHDWYYLEYGSVHIVVMSTEHNFTTGSTQYQWLKAHLSKNIDRQKTPWVIFTGHRPMYVDTIYEGDLSVAKELREHIEPLLQDAAVDLALWGHHHSYQRTCPVHNETCADDGITNVIIGMAGHALSTDASMIDKPKWLEVLDYEHYGYSRITANATTLVFEYIRNDDNKVYDCIAINDKKNRLIC